RRFLSIQTTSQKSVSNFLFVSNALLSCLKAIILAAGKGTRLRPLTFMRQKPMTPVGSEPAIFYLVSHLSKEGFDDIVVIVGGSLKHHIMDYLGDGSRFGLHINY